MVLWWAGFLQPHDPGEVSDQAAPHTGSVFEQKTRLATYDQLSQISVAGPKLAVGVVCGHVAVDLSQFHCKLFMHWMQLILSRNKFIQIHACAREKPALNSEPVPVTQKFAGDLQTFPCISVHMRKVKFFGPNTSV